MNFNDGDNSFANKISNFLKTGNTKSALSVFTDNRNHDEVYNNAWDLVPIIGGFLTETHQLANPETFKTCEELLRVISEQSKPDDVLLQFIEQIETAEDDAKFSAFIRPTERVLRRLPDKRVTSLAWCFNAIKAYLSRIPTPQGCDFSGKERLLVETDSNVVRILELYTELLAFVDTFVAELEKAPPKNMHERKLVLGKFLVDLLGKPLGFLNWERFERSQPEAKTIADELLAKICKVATDPFIYLQIRKTTEFTDLFKPQDLSLAIFYYLLLVSDDARSYPRVYEPIYLLNHLLHLIVALISNESELVVEKGLFLADKLILHLVPKSLPFGALDVESHAHFCTNLEHVIVNNRVEEMRKKGLRLMHVYMWAFSDHGRYAVVWHLMKAMHHSCLKGYIVTQFKEMMAWELKRDDAVLVEWYNKEKLADLMAEFTRLKDGEKSDLVDGSDQIVSTLNLLVFLALTEKRWNKKRFDFDWDLVEKYLENLRLGLDLSREHYNLKIRDVRENRAKSQVDFSVSVHGASLFEMPDEKKIEIMNMSLTTLDVIDSLLSYVQELMRAPQE